MQAILRESDIGVRYRGDEFAAILPDTSIEEALGIAEDLKITIREMDISNATNGKLKKITVSYSDILEGLIISYLEGEKHE